MNAAEIQANYAKLSDKKLIDLAAEAHKLLPEAQAILKQEINKRSIEAELSTQEVAEEFDDVLEVEVKLQTIAHFREYSRALVAKSLLESEGIPCFVVGGTHFSIGQLGLVGNTMSSHQLSVSANDAQAAIMLLNDSNFKEFLR
jgi:hypothetical protein